MAILELVRGRFGYLSVSSTNIDESFFFFYLFIGAAPYEGCLRTLVEGIKPFVVRLGVKMLTICFPMRHLRFKTYFGISYLLISCLEMLETSVLGLGQDLGLLLVLGGAMTNSAYVSRYSFNLIPYRFKVRDRFSAYTTCMGVSAYDCLVLQDGVFIEEDIFVEKCFFKHLRRLAMLKIGFSFVCRVSCSKCSRA
uniref:Uncharacterized protein n=1 Tax=Brassica oleracea TaxID=3712 RepID=A0A3P6EXF8_BRAOL|nr:unnamed protein product [Brassica oleracea]